MPVRIRVIPALVGAAVVLLAAGQALAIPAFTRLYKAECSTCHTIYPELNEYGEAFLKNSYVYVGKKKAPGQGKEEAGSAQAEAEAQHEAFSLAGIPEILPVSLTATIDGAYDEHPAHLHPGNPADSDRLDLSSRSLRLQAGGTFKGLASFFVTYNLYAQGNYDPLISNVANNTSPNVDELFFIGRHLFGSPINVRVGRLKPKLSLWKGSNKTTITSLAPLVYKVGKSQFSIDSPTDALEVNSLIGPRVYVAAGVVDRNGHDKKEGYGHISCKLGGSDYLGHEPDIDLDSDSIWDYLVVTLGGYGYYGSNASTVGGVANRTNYFYRAGGDLDVQYQRFRTRVSGVYGRDSNPNYLTQPEDTRSLVLAAESEFLFGSNVIGVFRYEYQDDGTAITRRYIPAVAYAPIQNTKLVLQYDYEGVAYYAAPGTINRTTLLALSFGF